jgi:hypothetical protein
MRSLAECNFKSGSSDCIAARINADDVLRVKYERPKLGSYFAVSLTIRTFRTNLAGGLSVRLPHRISALAIEAANHRERTRPSD